MDSGVDIMNGTGIGALLKASRVRRGEDIEDIAQQLRIRHVYLQALEDGRNKELPGHTYAVGFVRAYAEYLGLDSNEVVRRFKLEGGKAAPATELIFPTPLAEGGIPSGAIMLVGVVVASLAYGGWYLSTIKEGLFEQYIEPLPARLIALLPPEFLASGSEEDGGLPVIQTASEPPVPALPSPSSATAAVPAPAAMAPSLSPVVPAPAPQIAAAAPSEPLAAPAPAAPAATHVPPAPLLPPITAAPSEPVRLAATLPPPAAMPSRPAPAPLPPAAPAMVPAVPSALSAAAAAPPIPPLPSEAAVETASIETPTPERAFGLENTTSRILLRARSDSWVQIRDTAEKRYILTRLLRAGDSYQVPDLPGLVLKTGNAGALDVFVDGAAVPPVGAIGAVKSISLDAEKLVQGVAATN